MTRVAAQPAPSRVWPSYGVKCEVCGKKRRYYSARDAVRRGWVRAGGKWRCAVDRTQLSLFAEGES